MIMIWPICKRLYIYMIMNLMAHKLLLAGCCLVNTPLIRHRDGKPSLGGLLLQIRYLCCCTSIQWFSSLSSHQKNGAECHPMIEIQCVAGKQIKNHSAVPWSRLGNHPPNIGSIIFSACNFLHFVHLHLDRGFFHEG